MTRPASLLDHGWVCRRGGRYRRRRKLFGRRKRQVQATPSKEGPNLHFPIQNETYHGLPSLAQLFQLALLRQSSANCTNLAPSREIKKADPIRPITVHVDPAPQIRSTAPPHTASGQRSPLCLTSAMPFAPLRWDTRLGVHTSIDYCISHVGAPSGKFHSACR
ncbi:hypothetical protein K491DRAFT_677616 [Lophiostoma macrostomum CBS 122681]|uniref:Uncharacterized protein n=1 Tax=Lophiostoma macrostomum CBS 122681 TaxID=1314788 RepID=A0A6A6TCG5_9PLEO|nr:hypothetical protein K491DRAFT_677616 [Lophiostoma macrostomum CBS 122681]